MKRLFYFLCVNFIFFTSSAQTTQFVISTTTTNNANEYQWDILDSDSTTVLFSSSVFSDSSMVNDTVTLNDCSDYYFVTSSNDTANSTWSSGSSVYVIELASSDTAIINVIVLNPTLDLGSDLVLCGNDTITLDATANFSSYVWSSGDSLQLTSVIQGGTYSVVVTDSLGCSTSDTISIFHSITQADLGADLNICGLDSIVLGVSSFSSYSWSNGDTLQNSAVTQVGTYTVSVVDTVGCLDSDTIVIFESAPSVDLGPNVVALCGSNDTITLDATSIYSSYSWSTGDTLQSLAVNQAGN
jgi:hypothetical protein